MEHESSVEPAAAGLQQQVPQPVVTTPKVPAGEKQSNPGKSHLSIAQVDLVSPAQDKPGPVGGVWHQRLQESVSA